MFYTFDAHGSVCQRLDGGGGVLSSQTFDAYGYRQSTDGDSDPYAGFGGQSGYYTDWETGTAASALEMLGLRYYDPQAGRFLTRDPASYGGGANLYEYCNNRPTGEGDPSGCGLLLPLPIGSVAGGCLGAVLINGIVGGGFSGNSYEKCLGLQNCLFEMAAAGTAWGITLGVGAVIAEFLPEFAAGYAEWAPAIEGCLEGFLSAAGHVQAEKDCATKCKPWQWDICDTIGSALDIAAGCIMGLLGRALDKFLKGSSEEMGDVEKKIDQGLEGFLESAASSLGLEYEQSCGKSH